MSPQSRPQESIAVSVVVPTRLRHRLLARAITSVLNQTFLSFEILLVDDNPPHARLRDDALLAELLREPKIRLLEHDQPKNAASARNVALRAARGEWLSFLDDDDSYRPEKLQKQWQRAVETGLRMGMCGVAYHLAWRIREARLPGLEYGREKFLLIFQALPSLFHQSTQGKVLFNEDLDAGEDAYYFHQLIEHFRIDRLFNIPDPLVDVYLQPGHRVNTNAEAAWKAAQAVHRDFGKYYAASVADAFLIRARLGYLKLQKGLSREMLRLSRGLLKVGGKGELRFILNCWLYRIPWLRRYLVS
jgi:glycosyltransferase involved in cell wall biosynthesis